jgi:hypothetical protein
MILADAYVGRNMDGIRPGEIKKLLVLEVLPKSVSVDWSEETISLGSTFFLERVLGTVPVEADGSAHFEVPAMRPVFFAALDENDVCVKKMLSSVSVVPGETVSCVGCHEPRTQSPTLPPANTLAALERPASRIAPIPDMPGVFDFPRDIQPILDRYCVSCHNYEKYSGKTILTGDRGPIFSHSYHTLMTRRQVVNNGHGHGNRAPRSIGSAASPMMKKIDGSHHGVDLTPHERRMVRLWIESGSVYAGTYASLGSGSLYFGTHAGPRYAHPELELDREVLARRCYGCHVSPAAAERAARQNKHPWPRDRSNDDVVNLTRPDRSLLLLAPLAKAAGGLGLCRERPAYGNQQTEEAGAADVFVSRDDPDYGMLLTNLTAAVEMLDRIKRFDMPGFIPNDHYVREMKRCGALDRNWTPADGPFDVYACDQRYYELFWHRPKSFERGSIIAAHP